MKVYMQFCLFIYLSLLWARFSSFHREFFFQKNVQLDRNVLSFFQKLPLRFTTQRILRQLKIKCIVVRALCNTYARRRFHCSILLSCFEQRGSSIRIFIHFSFYCSNIPQYSTYTQKLITIFIKDKTGQNFLQKELFESWFFIKNDFHFKSLNCFSLKPPSITSMLEFEGLQRSQKSKSKTFCIEHIVA